MSRVSVLATPLFAARNRAAMLAALMIMALLAGACGSASGTGSQGGGQSVRGATAGSGTNLTVFAAASLREVLDRVEVVYAKAYPWIGFSISTDSSAALEAQIEQGAPADVFLSADTTNAQKVLAAGLASGRPTVFAGNTLAIVVPRSNPAGIQTPADLARPGVKIVAAAESVPISAYASHLVANLASISGYPAGYQTALSRNVVSREANVSAVLAKVELGEADAGIVYRTDALAATKVLQIGIPPQANVAAEYAGVVLKSSPHTGDAAAFLTWLAGPAGQAVLQQFGFVPPAS